MLFRQDLTGPVKITLIYLVIGGLWILLSDAVLLRLLAPAGLSPEEFSRYQTAKGSFYVLSTAILLYFLVRSALTSIRNSEAGLSVSQERIKHLLSASPTVLYALKVQDGELRAEWISDSITRILGYSHAEALQPGWWWSKLHPDDKAMGLELSKRLLLGNDVEGEYRFFDKQGDIHWIRDLARVLPGTEVSETEVIGSWIDVTRQHQEAEQQRQLWAAFQCMGDGIIVMTEDLEILSSNPAMQRLMEYSADELIGKHPGIFKSGIHDDVFFHRIRESLKNPGTWQGEVWNRIKSGRVVPFWVTASTVKGQPGSPDSYILIYKDMSILKNKEAELERMAHYDLLTKLPNRILLLSRLEHAINQASINHHQLAVLYVDLDDFKSINDSLGHTIGDQLLIEVAGRFRSCIREEDTLARVGGDEFLILIDSMQSPDLASTTARNLLDSLLPHFTLPEGHEVFAEACIGISLFPEDGDTTETLLQTADTAMYMAKQSGRNDYSFYKEDMGSRVSEKLDMITALRHSLARDELRLLFQPKVDLAGQRLTGAEALLRWERPEHGMVSPEKFISAAENSGLIVPMGEWVIEAVAAQLNAWIKAGLTPVPVSLNVSVRQFRTQNLANLVRTTIAKYAIPPELIGLEITETALMEEPEKVHAILQELKEIGVKVYLDDFGTGFSSLAYLSKLELDYLKIDMSFTRKIDASEKDNNIVISMIELARNLDMKTVAEGVESNQQLDFLKHSGCDEFQGFLYSRPLPADEFSHLLAKTPRPQPESE